MDTDLVTYLEAKLFLQLIWEIVLGVPAAIFLRAVSCHYVP